MMEVEQSNLERMALSAALLCAAASVDTGIAQQPYKLSVVHFPVPNTQMDEWLSKVPVLFTSPIINCI